MNNTFTEGHCSNMVHSHSHSLHHHHHHVNEKTKLESNTLRKACDKLID
jgi:hypothetical protein